MALVIWLLPDAFNSFLRASEGNKFTIPILREVFSRVTLFKIKFKKEGSVQCLISACLAAGRETMQIMSVTDETERKKI